MPQHKKVKDIEFYEFISEKKDCRAKDIINKFKDRLSESKKYARLKKLVKEGYLIHENRYDPYTINPYKVPDITQQDEINKKNVNYEHQLTLLDTLALRDNELKTWLKENVTFEFKKKFHPSNRMNQLFNELFYSFLVDFYLNNPDFWYMYKKPEDMNFSFTINVNWGKNPKIFEILKEHKKRCFKDNFLYPIGISKYSLEVLGIKERRKYIFPTYDEKRLYDIAIGQTIHREKQRKKTYVEIDEQIMKVINSKYPLLTKESLEKMPDDIVNGIFQDVNLRFLYIHPFDDYEKDFFNKIKLQKNIDKEFANGTNREFN